MTKHEYNEKIVEKYGSQIFEVYEAPENIKNRDRIILKCSACGALKEVEARSFIRIKENKGMLKRDLCANCKAIREEQQRIAREKRKEEEEITLEKLQEKLKNFEVLEILEYPRIKVRCKLCGSEFDGYFWNIYNSKKCKFCSKRVKYTEEDLQKLSDDKFGEGKYKIERVFTKQYSNYKLSFVEVSYNGKLFSKSVSQFLTYGFEREVRRTLEYYDEIVKERTDGRIRIPLNQKYTTADSMYIFEDVKRHIQKKFNLKLFIWNGCNFYSKKFSSYAIKVFSILNKKHIYFSKEKRFYQTGTKRFDIMLKDGKLIEVDGSQHFKNSFPSKNLEKVQEYDRIKNDFCAKNNKFLLRLPWKLFEARERKNELEEIISLYINEDFESLKKYKDILFIHDGVIENEDTYVPINSDIG